MVHRRIALRWRASALRVSWVVVWLLACANGSAHAADSIWSTGVGKILPSDDTVWCAYETSAPGGVSTVKAKLQRRSTSGSLVSDNYTDATTSLRLRLQCRDVLTGTVGAPLTSASFASGTTLACPANSVATNVRCMLRSSDASPFTYGGGSQGGDPCGNGISEITLPAGTNGFKGQVSGYSSELNFRGMTGNKLFNAGVMNWAEVHGTDMGYFFYSGGKLWTGYGDTWANALMTPVFPTLNRGSVLFSTNDLDASDANGLTFSSFHGAGFPNFAVEAIPCCHNLPFCDEISAIGTAGFGLREGGNTYRILWFNAIAQWAPVFVTKVATLSWSTNGGDFARSDSTPGTLVPKWSNTSSFGAGAIYQDRLNGYVYFFGTRPYQPTPSPIRLARVEAKLASVLDRTKYEYWSGSDWVKNAADPMQPSELSAFGPAADIIPASVNPGPEFSVAFDAYANRYILLFETNRATNNEAVELWQASSLTGPWSKVTNGADHLPRAAMTGGTWWPYNFFYGPYMSEQLMKNGGQTIYYQMSEWNGIPAFRPYNTGLWTFNINRNTTPGCTP